MLASYIPGEHTWSSAIPSYFSLRLSQYNVQLFIFCILRYMSYKVKILGATLDANLTMAPHVKALSSSCFYHIRSFRQICSSLDDTMALSVASAHFFMPGSVELYFVWHFAEAHSSPSTNSMQQLRLS